MVVFFAEPYFSGFSKPGQTGGHWSSGKQTGERYNSGNPRLIQWWTFLTASMALWVNGDARRLPGTDRELPTGFKLGIDRDLCGLVTDYVNWDGIAGD
jgi:hypothetical protein